MKCILILIQLLITSLNAPSIPLVDDRSIDWSSSASLSSSFSRFFLIILENKNQEDILNDLYMGSNLLSKGHFLSNMHAIAHPSQPNYIALITGGTNGISSDYSRTIDVQSIIDLLEEKGKTWKTYQEGYPSICFTGAVRGKYVRKHNPFISIKNIQTNSTRCSRIVNADQLQVDIDSKTVPDFVFYTPDLDNDGHDQSISHMSNALKTMLDPLLADPYFQDTLFYITFDENEILRDHDRNKIYSLLIGKGVSQGTEDNTEYNHYSLLAFLENAWNLGNLGANDATATPITIR